MKTVLNAICLVFIFSGFVSAQQDPLPIIQERSDDQVRISDTTKFFRPAQQKTPIVPNGWAGSYTAIYAITFTEQVTDSELNGLENLIEGLDARIRRADALIGASRIPVDRLPSPNCANNGSVPPCHTLHIGVNAGFVMLEILEDQ